MATPAGLKDQHKISGLRSRTTVKWGIDPAWEFLTAPAPFQNHWPLFPQERPDG